MKTLTNVPFNFFSYRYLPMSERGILAIDFGMEGRFWIGSWGMLVRPLLTFLSYFFFNCRYLKLTSFLFFFCRLFFGSLGGLEFYFNETFLMFPFLSFF
jgi:hypothetical protein